MTFRRALQSFESGGRSVGWLQELEPVNKHREFPSCIIEKNVQSAPQTFIAVGFGGGVGFGGHPNPRTWHKIPPSPSRASDPAHVYVDN